MIIKALRRHALSLAATLLPLAMLVPAHASVMKVDSLSVFRDGTASDWISGQHLWLDDGFDNGVALLGPNFTGGSAAYYGVIGLVHPEVYFPEAVREQGSQMSLDPGYAALSSNAVGVQDHALKVRLLTNLTGPDVGLAEGRSFAAVAQISLSSLPDVQGSFGLRLSDQLTPGGKANDVLELSLWHTSAGLVLNFRRQDFVDHTILDAGSAAISTQAGADDIALILAHPDANSKDIYAFYGYTDGHGNLTSPLTQVGMSVTAFNGESHTVVELRATQVTSAVSEPQSLALMAVGLGLLGLRARRQR